ncbi:Transcription factor bHLH19 [Camellia lanceoleosa]|uniref:Transcription factor bHLH19 n=1 Tax=Camellia lanceoleosa TaxID=1840588 RepID=A0ACC0J0G2_9ERIC|nr:Transcription factor bHLH19 [Camellia lanceoleosa]
MDALASSEWLHELMNSAVDESLDEFFFKCLSPEVYSSYTSINNESIPIETSEQIAAENVKTDTNHNMALVDSSTFKDNDISLKRLGSPSTQPEQVNGANTYCIGKPNDDELMAQENMNLSSSLNSGQSSEENQNDASETRKRNKRVGGRTRGSLHARNHILAERKRRERLSQMIISLCALIPGLARMDKASILEGTVKYIKQLQERERTLEKVCKRKLVEPTVFSSKRFQSSIDDDDVSSEDNFDEKLKQLSPEIEARLSDNNVLIRIHCDKRHRTDIPAKILSEMQTLHLNVTNSVVVPFGNAAIDMTIIAQMDNGFNMTAKDLVKNLRLALVKLL